MNSTRPLLHCPDQRPVDELVRAVGLLGVLADEVADRGVAVAGHRDQVGEGRLDQARLAATRRPVKQGGDSLGAQCAQRLDVGHAGQYARPVDLPSRPGHRARLGRRGGSLRRGRRRWRGWRGGRLRRCRRGGRLGGGRGGLRRGGGLGGDGDGCGGGRGVGLVADGLACEAAGLGPVGESGQRVADRAGRAAEVPGDLADRVRARAGGQPLGNLAAKLAVAEPALRGRGGNSGAVIGNTSGKTRGPGIAGGRGFAMTQVINYGEFPPEFPGTQRRYLAFSEAVNDFPPRNSQFPRIPSLTAAELITVLPRAFPPPPAAFPAPALAPASLLAHQPSPGRTPSRGRQARACERGPGGARTWYCTNTMPRTGDRELTYVTHVRPPQMASTSAPCCLT